MNAQIEIILKQAEEIAIKSGERFTEPRKQVLETIAKALKPIKAYDILQEISRENDKSTKPPTIYRALEFLERVGLIHKIESDATYSLCSHHNHCNQDTHVPLFLICDDCGEVIEKHILSLENIVKEAAQHENFKLDKLLIEARGRCKNCNI